MRELALEEEERELFRTYADCDEWVAKKELWADLERVRAALAKAKGETSGDAPPEDDGCEYCGGPFRGPGSHASCHRRQLEKEEA